MPATDQSLMGPNTPAQEAARLAQRNKDNAALAAERKQEADLAAGNIDPSTGLRPTPDGSKQAGIETGVDGRPNVKVDMNITKGLYDNVDAIGESKYANNGYGVSGGRATNRNVNENETSQYQLDQMLKSDSPLMRRAAAAGMANAGSRGLMNSSIAGGNAMGQMIDKAQPFALQDASWYGKTASDNMSATNDMSKANLNARVASMQAGAQRDNTILAGQVQQYGDIGRGLMGMEDREDNQNYKAEQDEINRSWTSDENMLTNTLAWAQTKLDAATRMGMSRAQATAEMYASIMANPDKKFSASERVVAVNRMQQQVNEMYGDADLSPYELSFDPATGTYDESLRPDSFFASEENPNGPRDPSLPGFSRNPDGTYTLTVPADFEWSSQFNALSS